MKSVDDGHSLVRVSRQTKAALDKVRTNVPWVARVRSYDDAIQWCISHLDVQGLKELQGEKMVAQI